MFFCRSHTHTHTHTQIRINMSHVDNTLIDFSDFRQKKSNATTAKLKEQKVLYASLDDHNNRTQTTRRPRRSPAYSFPHAEGTQKRELNMRGFTTISS
jgi:hypothetical protein